MGEYQRRWMAETHGTRLQVVIFEELFKLHDIIERGPNRNTIEHIIVTLNTSSAPTRKII